MGLEIEKSPDDGEFARAFEGAYDSKPKTANITLPGPDYKANSARDAKSASSAKAKMRKKSSSAIKPNIKAEGQSRNNS
jgi:hypothetical protein